MRCLKIPFPNLHLHFTFTFSHLADAFIQSDLQIRTKIKRVIMKRQKTTTTQEVFRIRSSGIIQSSISPISEVLKGKVFIFILFFMKLSAHGRDGFSAVF